MGVFNLFRSKKKEEEKATSKFIDDEWIEVSAPSQEEAIERACVALNTNPTHLEVKFLSKDGKKLRARKSSEEGQVAKPAQQRAPQGRPAPRGGQSAGPARGGRGNNPRNSNRGENKNDSRADSRNAPRNEPKGDSRNARPSSRTGGRSTSRNAPRQDEQTDETFVREGSDTEPNFNTERHGRGYSKENNYDNDQYEAQQKSRADEEDFVEEVEEETDLGRKAKEILLQIVQKIEANATIELYETNKTIRLEIISSESGLFIGKFGQTLDSIQHLLKKILEIKFQDGKNLVVDAEDYRVRREELIESKARKLAKKARQEGRPVSVEPMNAMDRRIVHMALKGEPGIETKSVGEGSSRRVLIVPKRRSQGGRSGAGSDEGGRGRGGQGRGFQGRGRSSQDRPAGRLDDGNSRIHDSYDVPALPKSEVFGDNPEEYFENSKYDDEK
jgi:predicted RNA-binding protein Jag